MGRAVVWARRLLLTTGVTAGAGYGAFHTWVRSYDPGVSGPERAVRVLVDPDGGLKDESLRQTSTFRVLVRYAELCLYFLPLMLTWHLCYMHPRTKLLWQELFIEAIQKAGPAFIKLAQWLATRRDIVDPEFREYVSGEEEEVHFAGPHHRLTMRRFQLNTK